MDCLDYQKIPKRQNLYCEVCNKYTQMENVSRFFSWANIFIFLLNRGNLDKDNSLNNIPFKIEEKIDISKYFVANLNSKLQYKLTGIVSLTTKSNKNEYVSFCKSPFDQNWYLYNDCNISQLTVDEIIKDHNNDRSFIPFILVYKLNE